MKSGEELDMARPRKWAVVGDSGRQKVVELNNSLIGSQSECSALEGGVGQSFIKTNKATWKGCKNSV